MRVLIADTFTDSLARLTGDEQKATKTTAFDLQLDPVNPGMAFHKLDGAKDKNFWSVRVTRDIRLIVHKTPGSLLLCYVDHHDKAYAWAERRKLEAHPKTGAAQWVEIRETVQEVVKVVEVPQAAPTPRIEPSPLFLKVADEELLGYGVPSEWLPEVRAATEETLLTIAERLPGEAAEALLELATGGIPRVRTVAPPLANPFDHPDAQRRFRVMADVEELARALESPWDKWTVFLHPAQRELVEQDYAGPARVSGSAGTGKTIVALHRAVFLARRHPDSRVLLTTFSVALANALRTRLRRLVSNTPHLAERLEVQALDSVGERLYEKAFGKIQLASRELVRRYLSEASAGIKGLEVPPALLLTEWLEWVDAWQLASWEAYRDAPRLGRKTRLPESQRAAMWAAFESVRARLAAEGYLTRAGMFHRLAAHVKERKHPPFEFVVVDEAQDVNAAQLRFLAACGADRPNGLFFAGDLGQRIFQLPFSWRALGVDVRGRSHTLHLNYRTSHQIRMQADCLLAATVADVDGIAETRKGTVSVFNGPDPAMRAFPDAEQEGAAVGSWLSERAKDGVVPHEMAVFVRSEAELPRAKAALALAGLPYKVLDDKVEAIGGHVALSTMHLAKGLEFRAVAVMACDDEVLPLQARIESITDDADLEEIYNTERHLLYVACTRARDNLHISCVEPRSEFIDDRAVKD